MPQVVTSWDETPAAAPAVDPNFNTKLAPAEENAFKAWKAKYAPKDSGDDYDLRGAFKAGLTPDPATGHWPDTFKKPNHPTFSDQSVYAAFGKPGSWKGEEFTPAAGKPAVVTDWGKEESAPSLMKRASSWVKDNAAPAASYAGNALLRLAGILPPVIALKGGEQAAGLAEFMTGMIPWAGNIAAGVTGLETGAEAAIKGKPIAPAFYKGVEGAQALLKPVEEILAPQSRTGKQIAEVFGKAVELGQELPGSPKSVAEAGYPGAAAVESGALQVLGIPALMKGAVSAVPLGGSLIAKHLADRARGGGSVSGAPGLGVPTENQSVAAQLRAIRPETTESPGGPTARPAGAEGEVPAAGPAAAPAPAAFNPTSEWQPVPSDAVLPPGLEIKMNMQTGLNEARLRPPPAAPAPPAKPIKDQIAGTKFPVMSEWGTVTGGEAVDLAEYFRKPVEDVRDGALRLLARGDAPMSRAAQAELDRRAAGRPAEPRAGVSPAPGQPPDMPAIPAPAGAPLFKPKPGDAPDMPRHGLKGIEVVEVPVAGLKLSEEVPQFKKAADAKGVVQPLGGKFDRIGVAPIQVWQRLNGDLEVISGRHRWDLAQRSGEESMPAQIHREADGFTARQAARLDAELNIRDEQGSIADYANYFRESGITEEAANAAGLLARAKGKSGFSIARDAAEEVYAAHRAGLLSDEAAHEIARAAPGNGSLQAVGLKLVNEGRPISLAVNTMRALSLMPRGEVKPDQGDIFGFDDSLIKEQMEVAKRAAAAQREIREQIAAVSGATKRPEVARKMGVDVKDPEAVQAKIDELRLESERMQNWPMYPDLVEKFGGRPQARSPEIPPAEIPEAATAAAEPAFSIDTATTGQPFQARLMRGEGRPDSPYNELVPQEGVLGMGRYTTNNLEFAKYFGPNITEHDIRLENPLVIDNDAQWRSLTKKAGWEFPNPISMTGDTSKASANIAKLQQMIIADGHDGVIVKVPEREDIGKTMQHVFGESQVIEFVQPDTKTQGMFQKRAPYNIDQGGLDFDKPETKPPAGETKPAAKPALELKGETEAERFNREQAAKKTKEKSEAEAKAAEEAARAAGVRKEIADRSNGADFELSSTEAVDKKRQAEIDRKVAEDTLSGQNKLFESGDAKYEAGREPAEQGVREKIRGQAPEGQLDLFSQVPVKGSPVKTFEKIVVEPEKVGERKISVDRVNHAGHAAAVFQDLARSPMEKFQVLGLDENNKPIAFFDMFAGTVTQTSVFPREVWTAVYQTPGVKSVWVAHQHPSGLAEPSRADQVLTKGLQQALTPDIGVELKGHLIVTKDRTIDIGPGGFDRNRVDVAVGMQPRTIPIMERAITREEGAREVLQSPQAVRDFFRNLDPGETGLLFLDAQNKAVSWWPMTVPEMAKLRTGDVNTGMGALLKKVGRTNAAAAIAYSPDQVNPEFTKAVRNVGTALSLADVKMLDTITPEGSQGAMLSFAERGTPMVNDSINGIVDLNIGITPKAMAQGVGAVADLARAAGRRAAETKLGAAASDWGAAVAEDLQTKIAPMAAGTDAARAITKDFANADRLSRYQWTRFDEILKKEFTQEQRQKMWDAAEDENLVRMQKIPEGERAGRGLDRLTKAERETMDTLQEYGDKLLERARDVGLFRGEGVEYWAPRMVAMIGEDGTFGRPVAKRTGPPEGPGRSPYTSPVGGNITTSAGSLKQRKYATVGETEAAARTKFGETAQVVRDIRTMPMAMARIERAIAGKELVNAIKEFGKTSGQDLVVDAAKDGYFTLDHPAFKTYRYRPDIKFTEAWDKNMWQAMHNFADSIGVKHERLLKMGGQTWGKAYMGGNKIETRFGGPETVMTHEIGHQLDYKYGLVERFFGGDRPKSDFILERQITKAEREGNTGLAEKYRKQITINREMRDLADLRFEGMETSEYYKKYVRKGTEKMANMVHAYVHAPEKFRAAAPTAYTEFKGFLNQHPELAGLDQIKPSLTLGSGGFVKRPPGEDFDVFPVYVSKEFEGPLKSVMSDIPGKLYSTMMDLKGKTMGVIMYSPLIHNGVEWGRALPLMPGKIITFKAYFDGNVAKNDPEIMSQAIKEGLVPIGHRFFMQDITGILEDPTLQPGRSWTAKLAGGAVGMVSKEGGQAVKRGIDAAGDFWHNTLLWDRIGDLQMGIYSNMKADLLKTGTEPETAGRMAAHFANRYAGALPNESMSAMARKVANFAFFSRTFTFGNLGVMKDMMTGLPRDVQAQIARDAGEVARFAAKGESQRIAIKAFGTDIAMMYAVNSAMQSGFDYLKRDQSLDEIEQGYVDRFDRMVKRAQESPSDLLKPFAMLESLTPLSENEPGKEYRVLYDYDQTGTGIYVRMPTGKIGEEFLSWATSPLDIVKRKEGTLARPLIQTLTNDRGFGRRVYNPDAQGFKGAAKAMGNIAWNMLSQQSPVDSLNAAIDIAKGHSDETDALKVVGPLFGLTFSKGAPGGPEVGELFTMERQHRAEVSEAMPEIKKLIKHDDMETAVERMYEAHMTPEEIRATIRFSTMPRARLTPRAMKKFFQIAPPEERERMERMREKSQ